MMMIGTRTTATMFGIVAAVAMIRMYMLCFEIATVMVDVAVLILMAVDTVAAAIDIDIAIAAEVRFVGSSSRNSGGRCISSLVVDCRWWRRLVVVIMIDSAAAAAAAVVEFLNHLQDSDRIGKRH